MVKPPRWFTVVSVVALIWNVLGVVAFIIDVRLSPADVASLPAAQQQLYASRPAWTLVATGLAVGAGVAGCALLLLRRGWSIWPLAISLGALIAQDVAIFGLTPGIASAGPAPYLLQGLVIVVGVALVWLAHRASVSGWLR